LNAVRLGLARGGIELRQTFTYWPNLFAALLFPVLQVVVLFLMRGHHVPGTVFSLGSLTLPSVIGMGFVFGGTLGVTALLIADPRFIALVMLPLGGIAAISGIFYPITHLAGWLQAIGQVFPMYWLGLGMRAALLPPGLASVEIGGSWRLPYVFLVLVLWSVLGLAAAPPLLRRMARRESGSRLAARRERAMLRPT
jgi:ABC-2 type transport system permease protein